jgi:branched-chain amino acid transport system permease protein
LRYKVVAFAASGALAGTAGALEAHRVGVIAPEQYSFGLLVVVLTYAMIGGSGHWLGPILATLAIGALKEYFDWAGTFWEDIIYGSILIGMMILAPKGLSDRAIWRFLRRRSAPKVHVEATSEVVPAQ